MSHRAGFLFLGVVNTAGETPALPVKATAARQLLMPKLIVIPLLHKQQLRVDKRSQQAKPPIASYRGPVHCYISGYNRTIAAIYMRAIMASPNSEHETSVAPSIRRAKS
jgi:hypothetical protein